MMVSLAECLYGMNIFKKRFMSDEAEKLCLMNIVKHFSDSFEKGELVGPIDIRKVRLDLDNGNVFFPDNESIEEMFNSIDTIKFLPPEVLKDRNCWSRYSDDFLLATILFVVKYYIHPFDGMLLYEKPIVKITNAIDFYANPIFVFDVADTRNQVLGYNDNIAKTLWDNSALSIKDYFIRNFTNGITSMDMRTDVKEVLELVKSDDISTEVRVLEINEKRFILRDGLQIFEKDIDSSNTSNQKILVVIKSTKNEEVLALGNASNDTWSVYLPDSKEILVSPKSVAPIVKGATISIGEYLANII